jgi:hypothetical protein
MLSSKDNAWLYSENRRKAVAVFQRDWFVERFIKARLPRVEKESFSRLYKRAQKIYFDFDKPYCLDAFFDRSDDNYIDVNLRIESDPKKHFAHLIGRLLDLLSMDFGLNHERGKVTEDCVAESLAETMRREENLAPLVAGSLCMADKVSAYEQLLQQHQEPYRLYLQRQGMGGDPSKFPELDCSEGYTRLSSAITRRYQWIEDYGYRLGKWLIANQSLQTVLDSVRQFDIQKPDQLLRLSPRQFERLIGELYLEKGFDVELTQQSRDGGADLVCIKRIGEVSFSAIVEVKRYQKPVGVTLVRQAIGANAKWNADRVFYVATSGYTSDALKFAQEPANAGKLLLHNGEDIVEWIKSRSHLNI